MPHPFRAASANSTHSPSPQLTSAPSVAQPSVGQGTLARNLRSGKRVFKWCLLLLCMGPALAWAASEQTATSAEPNSPAPSLQTSTVAATTEPSDTRPVRPNVIYIMADDMGWGDSSYPQQRSPTESFTGALPTPELEAMALAGMTFDRFYAASPVCSSTRAAFVTGRQHERTGVPTHNQGHIRNGEITMAELAEAQGYLTGHFGKWHLGTLDRELFEVDGRRGGYNRRNQFSHYSTPWCNGYETAFANEKSHATFNPYTEIRSSFSRFFTARGEAILSMDDGVAESDIDPRVMGDTSQIIVDQLIGTRDRVESGGEDGLVQRAVAEGRPFFATVWFASPHGPITHPGETEREIYYASIQDIDTQVGRVRRFLAANNLAENTLIVFTSDNGPSQNNDGVTGGLKGLKGSMAEGGIREPGLVEWQGEVPAGSHTNTPAGVIDLLPTLLDLWGMQMPDNRPMDGESLRPIWQGAESREAPLMFYFHNHCTMISPDGRYKIHNNTLYDLWEDYRERTNLAETDSDRYQQMRADWDRWQESANHSRRGGDYVYYVENTNARLITASGSSVADMRQGKHQDSNPSLLVERQFATVRQPLQANSLGTTGEYSTDNTETVAQATVVHSFLLHYDPRSGTDTEVSITFNHPIVGVIANEAELTRSDYLAFAPPLYAGLDRGSSTGTPTLRSGLEDGDVWTISEDGLTITFHLAIEGDQYDQVRILTQTGLVTTAEPSAS